MIFLTFIPPSWERSRSTKMSNVLFAGRIGGKVTWPWSESTYSSSRMHTSVPSFSSPSGLFLLSSQLQPRQPSPVTGFRSLKVGLRGSHFTAKTPQKIFTSPSAHSERAVSLLPITSDQSMVRSLYNFISSNHSAGIPQLITLSGFGATTPSTHPACSHTYVTFLS